MSLFPDSKPSVSRKALQGERLLSLIWERDASKGSNFIEISGIQGCGKTSLMLGFAKKIMGVNPDEIMVMRESPGNPVQVNKLGSNWRILCERSYPVKVFDLSRGMVDVTDDIRINYFDGVQHLLRYLHPGVVNLIYFRDLYKWVDLLDALKYIAPWKTVLWDEFEDICPEHASGIVWRKNKLLAASMKQLRKNRITLIANSQSNMDVDFRVRSKITIWCYLFGARIDRFSPISKSAIRSLSVGSGWVDHGHSFFGQFVFPAFEPVDPLLVVVPDGDGGDGDCGDGDVDGCD